MTQLWTKQANHFEVQIQVGNSWVQHCTAQVESEAESEAKKALLDPSIKKYRILSHAMTHRCSLVGEGEADDIIVLPPKMKPVGIKTDCPRCGKPAPLGDDGTNEWIFCSNCNSAFPN